MKKAFTKKAFTLAELSIVLVVLGIIIAMTIKGFGVLDAARLRNELGKINKFQTAYSLYFERTGKILPGYVGGADPGRLNIEPLYDYGLLEDDAEHNKDFADNSTNPLYGLFLSLCDAVYGTPDDNDTISYLWPAGKTYDEDKGVADGICLVFNGYAPVFLCGAETSYDDMKIHDGSGKFWGDGAVVNDEEKVWIGTPPSPKRLYNCSNANSIDKVNFVPAWAYMIF